MAGGDKLHFIIFIIIYMMVIGLVSSIFNPGMYAFGEDDYVSAEEAGAEQRIEEGESNWWDPIINGILGVFDTLAAVATFLWAGLTLNIPEVPFVVKILLCSPMWVGTGYVIAEYIRGI